MTPPRQPMILTPAKRRWLILAVSLLATTAACAFQFGLTYLIPALRAGGSTLTEAGTLTAAPIAGILTTMVLWGAAADHLGERRVLAAGLAGAAGFLAIAAAGHGRWLWLFLAGASSASVAAASGRLVLAWFPERERGRAMALRQTSQPLGVAVAALVLPVLPPAGAFLVLAGFCLLAAVAVAILARDPVSAARAASVGDENPYRTPGLPRIHAASALLVVPQATVATLSLLVLTDVHHWDAPAAGRLLACAQVLTAVARLGTGWWSDRVGSRIGPLRIVACAIAVSLALIAATAALPLGVPSPGALSLGVPSLGAGTLPVGVIQVLSALSIPALMAAAILTPAPNALAFTAVAELAGKAWAGRALAIQTTAQNAVGAATPPLAAALLTNLGYARLFALTVAFPLVAAVLPERR